MSLKRREASHSASVPIHDKFRYHLQMKEMTVSDSRKVMVDILYDVTSFCDTHHLKYYLGYGTLIGAIRHKGFIPWDDDIDIQMPRSDYEDFIRLYKQSGKYPLLTPYDHGCYLMWTKAYNPDTVRRERYVDYKRYKQIGVDIDIFPMDGQPENWNEYKKVTDERVRFYWLIARGVMPLTGLGLKKSLIAALCRLFNPSKLIERYVNSADNYPYQDSKYVGFSDCLCPYRDRHRREVFENRVKVEFENGEYWAPVGYDEYLKDLFGDYMQLPPIEQRKSTHTSKDYWKE